VQSSWSSCWCQVAVVNLKLRCRTSTSSLQSQIPVSQTVM
jgi:hypothetical protein